LYTNSNFGGNTPSLTPHKFNVVANLTYDTPNNLTMISTPLPELSSSNNKIIVPAVASHPQSISNLNIPPLPQLSQPANPSPSPSPSSTENNNNDNNNNMNLVIDIPLDNAQPNNPNPTDNSSTHSNSPGNFGNM
jgi:hypothetical protein